MKENFKRICKYSLMVVLVVFLFGIGTNIYAGITGENGNVITAPSKNNMTLDEITGFIKYIMDIAIGVMLRPISWLILVIAVIIFIIMTVIFGGLGGNFIPPLPDVLVFNKVPFFDVNFISPYIEKIDDKYTASSSFVSWISDLIGNFYYTMFVLAGAIFAITAMIIGIKLALSTIATEKAHYKQALMMWVKGIAVLFTAHFLILSIFTLNENIVSQISSSVKDEVSYEVDLIGSFPEGKVLKGVLNTVDNFFGSESSKFATLNLEGMMGLIALIFVNAIGGDIIYAIAALVLMGVSFKFIIFYIKRLFYAIILGIIAPIIVAIDILKKSIFSSSGIFNKWLTSFAGVVFTQTVQAFALFALLKVISQMNNGDNLTLSAGTTKELITAIILLAGLLGIDKIEKLIKTTFGIPDSPVGGLAEASNTGRNIIQGTMGAARTLAPGAKIVNGKVSKLSNRFKKGASGLVNRFKTKARNMNLNNNGQEHGNSLTNGDIAPTATQVFPSQIAPTATQVFPSQSETSLEPNNTYGVSTQANIESDGSSPVPNLNGGKFEISGANISGATINGATINGATINSENINGGNKTSPIENIETSKNTNDKFFSPDLLKEASKLASAGFMAGVTGNGVTLDTNAFALNLEKEGKKLEKNIEKGISSGNSGSSSNNDAAILNILRQMQASNSTLASAINANTDALKTMSKRQYDAGNSVNGI